MRTLKVFVVLVFLVIPTALGQDDENTALNDYEDALVAAQTAVENERGAEAEYNAAAEALAQAQAVADAAEATLESAKSETDAAQEEVDRTYGVLRGIATPASVRRIKR